MKTYYKVETRITDRSARIFHAGEVQAEHRPQNTAVASAHVDIYEDFFCTFEEADSFVRTQRRCL